MARSIFYDSLKKILFAFFAMLFFAPVFSATLLAGYTELSYVDMNAGSYLLTDLVPTYDSKIEMDFQTTTTVASPVTYLGGTTGNANGLRFAHITNKSFRFYAFGGTTDSTATVQDNTRYKYVFNNNVITLTSNDTTVFTNTLTETGTTNVPLALNGYNTKGTISQNLEGIYLYSFKMWNASGQLVANYVPAKQGNTVGFYDTVSDSFKTATAGTFAAGPEIQTYTMLEYIQSDGTQWIDPNITVTSENISTFKTEAVISNVTRESGSISGYSDSNSKLWYGITSSASPYYFYYSDGHQEKSFGIASNLQFYKFLIDAPNGSYNVYTESGEVVATKTGLTFSTPHSFKFYLFTYFPTGTSNAFKPQKIKYAKFWFGETLVRDMKPARRDSDGRVGMLDTVNNVFYDNAASTTVNFEAGPDLPEVTIKIATTKYNEDAFADLITTLNSAITKVTNIVDTTVAQASSIGTLATTKQDRPADGDCPAGRKCLLVTGTDGKPHWYLIQE